MVNYYKMQRLHNNRYFCRQNSLLEDKNWITVALYLKFLCKNFLFNIYVITMTSDVFYGSTGFVLDMLLTRKRAQKPRHITTGNNSSTLKL